MVGVIAWLGLEGGRGVIVRMLACEFTWSVIKRPADRSDSSRKGRCVWRGWTLGDRGKRTHK